MSKNFEKEYNEMLDAQIPDLWSRIEPQLHDKTVIKENNVTSIEAGRKKRKVSRAQLTSIIGGVLAASLVVGIVIPFGLNMKSSAPSFSDMAATTEAPSNYTNYFKEEGAAVEEFADQETASEECTNDALATDSPSDVEPMQEVSICVPVLFSDEEEYVPGEIITYEKDGNTYYCMYFDYAETEYIPVNEDERGALLGLLDTYYSEEEAEEILSAVQFDKSGLKW